MTLIHSPGLLDRTLWGSRTVTCAECACSIPAHDAIWHAAQPYCSVEHECADNPVEPGMVEVSMTAAA
jgi:hypothetical protein